MGCFLLGMCDSCGPNREVVPQWSWRELFTEGKALKQLDKLMLEIVNRVGGVRSENRAC